MGMSQRAPRKPETRSGNLRSTSDGLLTGVLFCGSCGKRLCYNRNTTVKTLADRTKRAYERVVYRCYRKINSRSTCKGQTTYVAGRIEEEVLDVVREYFANIRSAPTAEMLMAGDRTQHIKEDTLAQAETVLKKAQAEMGALEKAAVKALTGESQMDFAFINSLIPKRRANLENTLKETERMREELQDSERRDKVINHELGLILSWADSFDSSSFEVKRSIISTLIDCITVHRDYKLDIHFRISVEQYLGKAS